MTRLLIALLLSATSTMVTAADNACLSKKYNAYIDASLHWYEDLAKLTSEQYLWQTMLQVLSYVALLVSF